MKSVPLTNTGLLGLWNKKKKLSSGLKELRLGLGWKGRMIIYITVIDLTLIFFLSLPIFLKIFYFENIYAWYFYFQPVKYKM